MGGGEEGKKKVDEEKSERERKGRWSGNLVVV